MSNGKISDKAVVPLAIVFIVVLLGIVYLSLKAYVYYSTSSKLDDVIKQASLFAEVSYDGISSDLLAGSVSVDGIRVLPRTIHDVIHVREIRMAGDGPAFLFRDMNALAKQAPEALLLSVRGLSIGLDGELSKTYSDMVREVMRKQTGKVPGSCDFGGSMAAGDLRALGFNELSLDMSLQMSADRRSRSAEVSINMEIANMADTSFNASIKAEGSTVQMATAPSFDAIDISYSLDKDYMRGVRKYCARINKQTEQAYVDSLVNASDADFKRFYGFVPGTAIREAMKRFLLDPDTVEIHMKPSQSVKLETMHLYKFTDMIDMLGLTVSVNQQPLTDLSLKLDDKVEEMFGGNQAGDSEDKTAAKSKRPKTVYAYQDTAIKQLPQYLGAQVKITMQDGKQRSGALVSLKKDELQLEQRVHSGKFASFVPLADIQQLQVYRKVKAAP